MSNSETKLPSLADRDTVTITKPASNVLIIESHSDTADTVSEILKSEGYGVRIVKTRDQARSALESYIYDFILMDLFVPGLPADAFVKYVREHSLKSRIILMTAAGWAAPQAQTLGVSDWIGKPFKPDDLVEMLNKYRA